MNLEFKFNNDVYASIDNKNKNVFAYTKEQYGEDLVCAPIPFTDDNDMIEALKNISERINLNQHRDVSDTIFKHYQNCDIKTSFDGMLIVFADLDRLGNDSAFVDELTEFGAEFVGRHFKAKIISNGVCVAEITYS